jgi:hypothetical protein
MENNLMFVWFVTIFFVFCRRSPISIAAAVIYIIIQLSDDKKPLKGENTTNPHSFLWSRDY